MEIIAELGTGKSVGQVEVSNEMLIYAKSDVLVDCLISLYEKIFRTGIVPSQMNVAIIKPLIKDVNKPWNDISNTRPISISDVFSTILEKLLLQEIEKIHVNNVNKIKIY